MKRRLATLALATLLGACSKEGAPPIVAPAPEPDPLIAVFPPARATRVRPDTEIYADFAVDLDASTITAVNVYFKIDAMRYPVELIWDRTTRRLTIVPQQALRIGRTYTIEISPRVRRASGAPLFPAGWFWQFTMTSIRPIRTVDPPDDATLVSPFMRLRWDPNDSDAGPTIYTLFVSTDSSSVAVRAPAGTPLDKNRWIPTVRWGFDTVFFWAVRAQNLRTGEVFESDTWRFRTLPGTTPVENQVLRAEAWGYSTSANPGVARCNEQGFQIAATNLAAIRWTLPPPGTRFASVDLALTPFPVVASTTTRIRATQLAWSACSVRYPSTPLAIDPTLAIAVFRNGSFQFQSDALTAHVEAASRDLDLPGYVIETDRTINLLMLNPADATLGGMAIRVYRP